MFTHRESLRMALCHGGSYEPRYARPTLPITVIPVSWPTAMAGRSSPGAFSEMILSTFTHKGWTLSETPFGKAMASLSRSPREHNNGRSSYPMAGAVGFSRGTWTTDMG